MSDRSIDETDEKKNEIVKISSALKTLSETTATYRSKKNLKCNN